nr:putative inorganic phosphate cotransporter [Penaeus vannamei]
MQLSDSKERQPVGNNWGFYTLLTDLPLYMKNMLQQDIKSVSLMQRGWAMSDRELVGDRLRKGTLSTVTVRKAALAFVECNRGATIAILFVAVTLQGGIYTGFMVNHVDIAPNFAGTLFGITNAAATIPGWVAPMTVGAAHQRAANVSDSGAKSSTFPPLGS